MRKACLDSIYKLAKNNKKVCFIGSDLGAGVLNEFKENIPERFFMEGVSEQYITGMSAGLAIEGFIPYFNTIATFITRRNFEQNIIDLGLHNLPVRLIGNGGGLVYASLGPTHQATDDIALMRIIPNMNIIAPCDSHEMEILMMQSVKIKGPLYIRLAKGGDKILTKSLKNIKFGRSILFGKPKDLLFVTTGVATQECLLALDKLKKIGIFGAVLHNATIKPFDRKNFMKHCKMVKKIITVEEHFVSGGLGSLVLEILNDEKSKSINNLYRIGIENKFVKKYGTQQELFDYCGISADQIFKKVKFIFNE